MPSKRTRRASENPFVWRPSEARPMFFFSSRRRHTRCLSDWSSDVCSSDLGSDPSSMRTTARLQGDEWVLNGSKMWITNGGVADLAVVWARTDDGVRGFIVPKESPGFTTRDIEKKDRKSVVEGKRVDRGGRR